MSTQALQNSTDAMGLTVSPDRMAVTLCIAKNADVSASSLIARIKELGVSRFDDGAVIEAIELSKTQAVNIQVAAGVPPVDDRPERIEYRVPAPDGPIRLTTKVELAQVIAAITPSTIGTDGSDVFGQPIERRRCEPLQIGRNLAIEKGKIICKLRGNLRLKGNILSVEPLLELRGDDGNVAPIIFDGDTIIRGSLNEGRTVQITGGLTVGGAIEAVQLKAGGSVRVQGGIVGKTKGKYVVDGDLHCRFVSGGFFLASGDVHVQSDITDSRVACGGRLIVEQGVIFGGALAANCGITCQTLGHAGGNPTLLEAGEGIASRSFLASANLQIEANQKRIQIVRAKVGPLLKVMKTLTPEQREKVTELLYEADELEVATKKLEAELELQLQDFSKTARAEITVSKVIHPGVTVRFGNVKTTFTSACKGPFTLVPHEAGNRTQILLISTIDQTKLILPTSPVEAPVATAPLAKAA